MLVSFTLKNWMSFAENVQFSMIGSKEQQHSERIPKILKFNLKVLPIAAIYGGNASGKTNFFRALSFAKSFIIKGTQPDSLIPVETFSLNDKLKTQPSEFTFQLLINEKIYELSFQITEKKVKREKLIKITSSSEKILYEREGSKINLDANIKSDFLKYAFKGTRDNQLFLTNTVFQKIEIFKPVYDWFKEDLKLIAPDSRFDPIELFFNENDPLYQTMNKMLPLLDTGISQLCGEETPLEASSFSQSLKSKLLEDVKEDTSVRLIGPNNRRLIVARKNGELITKKLVTFHSNSDGAPIKFEINQESDGTQRVIDLLPAFLDLASENSKKVYIIDEIDRSLHPLLTKKLIEYYLENCNSKTRAQLLLTTHNGLLMDQEIFRRDELWVAERNSLGSSNLIPFSDYKDIRYDKDIRKSYLQGRLGGIPRFKL